MPTLFGLVSPSIDLSAPARSREEFIDWMIARYHEFAPDMSEDDARKACEAHFMDGYCGVFGDPAYDWTRSGARTLADEDMSYW